MTDKIPIITNKYQIPMKSQWFDYAHHWHSSKVEVPNPNIQLVIGNWTFIGIIGIYWILEIKHVICH